MEPEKISGLAPTLEYMRPVRRRPEDSDKVEREKMESICYALAHLRDPVVSLFGRIKVAGDRGSGPIERRLLLRAVEDNPHWIERKKKGRPAPHKRDTVRTLVRLALFEELYPNICVKCLGARWSLYWYSEVRHWGREIRWVFTECQACQGRGLKPWTDRNRADLLGMKYTTYKSTWSRRVAVIRGYISEFEPEIWRLKI